MRRGFLFFSGLLLLVLIGMMILPAGASGLQQEGTIPAIETATPAGFGLVEALAPQTNVRVQPDLNAERVGQIAPGTQYVVLGRHIEWFQILYPDSPSGLGWVHQTVVNFSGDLSQVPELEGSQNSATPPPSETLAVTLTPTPNPTETATLTITPTTIGPLEYPENINPLTGLPYPNEEARNRRNLILKVSNFPEVVRPQYGLSFADIVFEYEAEGGVTRFAAIFRSQGAKRVGSIRSARLIDLELVHMFNALLGYSGSNDWIREFILASDWRWRAISPQIGNGCPMYCRIVEDNRAFEHTLFADTDAIWAEASRIEQNQPFAVPGFAFDETPPESSETASDIYIDWYSPRSETRWQYNPEDNKYYRYDSGLPHLDAATGEQLTADNVVIIEVWHVDRPDVYESEIGGIALEQLIKGRARAWVFRDGRWYRGIWYHNEGRAGLFLVYDYEKREPIFLRPGQTWIEVVRKNSQYDTNEDPFFSVTISDDLVDVEATAAAVSQQLTAVPAMTQTQFAEWYGSPTPSQTWTPTPTGTWQLH